ncbi:similar to Saccharomyces cerevisiae YPL165C SET6 SET domain protein of unknown function [Maudiozyma saulgeensis]|uniref:SET domain-containing protein n=1 Tax=Maudiozyma saulgeensis TaxID=1789683 RepID=A0A1X7R8X5_9SACH|nr:similar to Saccharomyces cerevisiae YPL165C SET6 SET domain protein of unknown function [Kazachstania saulgeensis]
MTIDTPNGNITPFYEIKDTTWGGRSCFATSDIPKDTVILEVNDTTGSSIQYEFRKEVCHNCFKYNGKSMKYKIKTTDVEGLLSENNKWLKARMKKFCGAGLWFCSTGCSDTYLRIPRIIDLIEAYEILLDNHTKMLKRNNPDDANEEKLNSVKISQSIIDSEWRNIEINWLPMIDKMKYTKRQQSLPITSEDEYNCARFVCNTLFHLRTYTKDTETGKSFWNLQSNELNKMMRFPILLHFQQLVFRTLYILLPETLRIDFNIGTFRHIMGSEYGNAFGIWQEDESVDSREYFGYWVFPRASYFNHSCIPNITKTRNNKTMYFTLNKGVSQGDELCIDYSGVLDFTTVKRRDFLKENWFFDCQCTRCKLEI